ncbi:MAG: M3 family metallopeptidase [Bacteroidota bacterium]
MRLFPAAVFTAQFLLIPLLSVVLRAEDNPFFRKYNTPFGVPPFDQIKEDHYMPAFHKGIEQQQKEIKKIAESRTEPTFENTLAAMEKSGELLKKVSAVFFNMLSTNTNDRIRTIAKEVSPLLSKNEDDILLNEKLFKRIKSVYDKKDRLRLDTEQKRLLEETYRDFVKGGANLNEGQKEQMRKINSELSLLELQFSENLLKETNGYALIIDDKDDLAGLPESVIAGAAAAAAERGYKTGTWVFTLHNPSVMPFLQYSSKRELREKIFRAYTNRANNGNEYDNNKILSRIASLRVKRSNLLGYKSHADYVLEDNMAQNSQNVYKLLNQLWSPALQRAKQEATELQQMIDKEGGNFKLEAWDWRYYAEKLRKEKYALDDEVLRPYFKLDNVITGAFDVANKLYGLKFTERFDIPKYHKDARVFEVTEADGSHAGILYTDYFPRESKRGGAWMNGLRDEEKLYGKKVTPVIMNVFNFTKPAGDEPSLLTFDEVQTLFHEFGHGLHGLFADTKYPKLSGTSVPRDFVELPSQIMENWASEPEVLKSFAKHYKTGEAIPDSLIEKIVKSGHFNQGFATVEYLAASLLDLDYHTLTDTTQIDAASFEKEAMKKMGIIPEIVSRYRPTYFQHIFSNGYSAGYYSYIWAEVLDADAFDAFRQAGLFDQKTAKSLRDNILSRGGTEEPMVMYKRFRGAEPGIEPLLKRRGLK